MIGKWKEISKPFEKDISDALEYQHIAAQYIALVGRHLLPQEEDDSNTNMQYLISEEMLTGNALPNGIRVALHLNDMTLFLIDKNYNSTHRIPLEGSSREKVFTELKQSLSDTGIDISNFKDEMHYEMPGNSLSNKDLFEFPEYEFFVENTLYRHNAEVILKVVASELKDSSSVRVWPHHFDTGSYIPLEQNGSGEIIRSIGIGWSIPDMMVDEPYYYLSYWAKSGPVNMKILAMPSAGKWIISGWNGAVLKHSEIAQTQKALVQQEMVLSFFDSGIEILRGSLI